MVTFYPDEWSNVASMLVGHRYKTVGAAARAWRVEPALLSQILTGVATPDERLCRRLVKECRESDAAAIHNLIGESK